MPHMQSCIFLFLLSLLGESILFSCVYGILHSYAAFIRYTTGGLRISGGSLRFLKGKQAGGEVTGPEGSKGGCRFF